MMLSHGYTLYSTLNFWRLRSAFISEPGAGWALRTELVISLRTELVTGGGLQGSNLTTHSHELPLPLQYFKWPPGACKMWSINVQLLVLLLSNLLSWSDQVIFMVSNRDPEVRGIEVYWQCFMWKFCSLNFIKINHGLNILLLRELEKWMGTI